MTETKDKDQRIAELAEMLNNAHKAACLQVEDERDACARGIQFLLDVEEEMGNPSEDRVKALKAALNAVESRKDPNVRTVAEMAYGTMISEYVQACVQHNLDILRSDCRPLLAAAAKLVPWHPDLAPVIESFEKRTGVVLEDAHEAAASSTSSSDRREEVPPHGEEPLSV